MAAESKSVKITETKHLLLNGSPHLHLQSRWVGRWHRVDGGTPQGRFTGTGGRGKDLGRFGKGMEGWIQGGESGNCWWLKSGWLTSWGWGCLSHFLRGFIWFYTFQVVVWNFFHQPNLTWYGEKRYMERWRNFSWFYSCLLGTQTHLSTYFMETTSKNYAQGFWLCLKTLEFPGVLIGWFWLGLFCGDFNDHRYRTSSWWYFQLNFYF